MYLLDNSTKSSALSISLGHNSLPPSLSPAAINNGNNNHTHNNTNNHTTPGTPNSRPRAQTASTRSPLGTPATTIRTASSLGKSLYSNNNNTHTIATIMTTMATTGDNGLHNAAGGSIITFNNNGTGMAAPKPPFRASPLLSPQGNPINTATPTAKQTTALVTLSPMPDNDQCQTAISISTSGTVLSFGYMTSATFHLELSSIPGINCELAAFAGLVI